MKKIIFPDDFIVRPQPFTKNRGGHDKQWCYPAIENIEISVIGGCRGQYGDGITTFEVYDFRFYDDVEGYLTKEEVNVYINQNHSNEKSELNHREHCEVCAKTQGLCICA